MEAPPTPTAPLVSPSLASAPALPSVGDGPELPLVFVQTPEPVQPELKIALPDVATWSERAARLDKAIQAAKATESRYAARNLMIVEMWADRRRGDKDTMAKICRYAKTNASVVQWVLKMARKGDYGRLVRKAPPGRRGKRQLLLEALRNGTPAPDVQRQLNVHRTTVLRALHQLKAEQKTAA